MKKTTLFALAMIVFLYANQSEASQPPLPAGSSSQMKSCATQYHQKNIAKSQYHAFMTNCLKGAAATSVVTPAKPAEDAPHAPSQ